MKNPPTEVETEVQGFDPDLLSVLHVVMIFTHFMWSVVPKPEDLVASVKGVTGRKRNEKTESKFLPQ